MKQIISFKKELPFKTKVSDITSISLEREIKIEDDGIISGIFHITGDYKMNEGSINREEFSFDLPFDITIDPRYDINTIKVDIDDFYYDIMNNDILKVNIDLFIEAEYLPESLVKEETNVKEEFNDIFFEESNKEELDREKSINEDVDINEIVNTMQEDSICESVIEEVKIDNLPEIEREEIDGDLFSNLDNSETYVTYYVYIVKEEDNIDKILNKYGITKEELEDYNDISDVKVGDKLIIPKCNEK